MVDAGEAGGGRGGGALGLGLSRRAFLTLAVSLPWWAGSAAYAQSANAQMASEAVDQPSLQSFLAWSREATGFQTLDAELGKRYLEALLAWEPDLTLLLAKPPSLSGPTPREQALVDLVIETWYTGTVPTFEGTRTVTFEGALAWRCLPRPVPVTYCPT